MIGIATIPRIVLKADGARMRRAEMIALAEVRVQQVLSLPALCELTFEDPAGGLVEDLALSPGRALDVELEGMGALFQGDVTAVELVYDARRGSTLRVRAYDRLHRLRKRQPVRAHVDVDTAALATQLAGEIGLRAEVVESGPPWPRLMQHWQSDFELLAETAQRSGLYFTLRGETLHLLTLQGLGTPVPLELGDTLLEAAMEINADRPWQAVTLTAWDPSRIEAHHGRTELARVERDIAGAIDPTSLDSTGERMLNNQTIENDRQAEAAAQAELDAIAAGKLTLRGLAEGNPDLRPGTPVEVRGVVPAFESRYVLTSVTHRIDTRTGYVCEISSQPPPRRPRRERTVVAWGVVVDIRDPEGLGRIRVKLPAYDDLETGFLGVLTPGAGAGKGLISMPDVGDHVLVLFADEDRAQGIVIGGLYGAAGPPDEGGLQEGAVRRYTFLTPGGQRIQLDDTQKAIRLSNSDGSEIELSEGACRLHSKVDLTVEAPGRTVRVRGRTIRFEEA